MLKTSHDSETAAIGQQIFTADALIHKRMDGVDYILLARRAQTKKFLPGVYELPGGHIDYGEDMMAGLEREVKEEFAVPIRVGDPFYVYTYQNRVKGCHTIEVVYFATLAASEQRISINEADHSAYGWFTKEQVESVITDNRAGVLHSASLEIGIDHEILAMRKGLALLGGGVVDFG